MGTANEAAVAEETVEVDVDVDVEVAVEVRMAIVDGTFPQTFSKEVNGAATAREEDDEDEEVILKLL